MLLKKEVSEVKKINTTKNELIHRQYLMQELQINTFNELSKTLNQQIKKIFKTLLK